MNLQTIQAIEDLKLQAAEAAKGTTKQQLRLHHGAFLKPNKDEDVTRKMSLMPREGSIVSLCSHHPMPQLPKGRDVWKIKFIDSNEDDPEDRGQARAYELISLEDLPKSKLIEEGKKLYQLKIGSAWDDYYKAQADVKFGCKLTKGQLVENLCSEWYGLYIKNNKERREVKEKEDRYKERRETLLRKIRAMEGIILGTYIPLIVEQLTDEQVTSLLRRLKSDDIEKSSQTRPLYYAPEYFPQRH